MREEKQVKSNKRTRNRAVIALLLVCLIVCMTPDVMAGKRVRKTAGKFDGTKWSYNTKTKTLTLSCKGKMNDEYSQMNGGWWPWQVWSYETEKVVIKEGVTRLGSGAAYGFYNVKSVSLPKSLKRIGYGAFEDTKLTQIKLPSNLEIIEGSAFLSTKLKEIVIPEKTIKIGDSAFLGCKKLTKVQLPKKLEKISDGLFYHCPNLRTVTIPANVTQIGEEAFCKSGLTTITIPKKVTRINAQAFHKCTSLKKVTFRTKKLAVIDASLFEGCKKLTTITLPDSVAKLKEKAFKGSGLTTVTIPEKVTVIGEETFAGCKGLKEVIFSGSQITSIGSNAFLNIPADCVFKVPAGQAETMKAMLSASGLGESVMVEEYEAIPQS